MAQQYEPPESTPRPDPTELTTKQLEREINCLRDILDSQIKGQKGVLESRLDGMDKAINLLQATTDRQPAEVDRKVAHLQVLHEEKFTSIQTQFTERDTRTEQTSRDSKVAVDAALQAAKEAVGEQNKSSALAIAKSEGATSKQIDQQAQLIQTGTKAIDDKISDLKDRLTLIEGKGAGVAALWGFIIGAIGLFATVLGVIAWFSAKG